MSEQREQPEPKRCECGSAYYDGAQWVTRYLCDSTEPDDPKEIIVPVAHCPGECGCRLSVENGQPRVAVNIAVATIVAARDDLDAQENEEATT